VQIRLDVSSCAANAGAQLASRLAADTRSGSSDTDERLGDDTAADSTLLNL